MLYWLYFQFKIKLGLLPLRTLSFVLRKCSLCDLGLYTKMEWMWIVQVCVPFVRPFMVLTDVQQMEKHLLYALGGRPWYKPDVR